MDAGGAGGAGGVWATTATTVRSEAKQALNERMAGLKRGRSAVGSSFGLLEAVAVGG
jgi:hypothetical protein